MLAFYFKLGKFDYVVAVLAGKIQSRARRKS